MSAHVQPARIFQGVSFALESAQHEQSVKDVSVTSGRRPQLRRLGTCKCALLQDVSFVPGRGHGSLLDMPTFALIPRGPGVDATWRIDDEMRSDGLWKGRSGGIGYAARDMAQQIKREDPALRRKTREREEERERREREHARVGDARVRKTREREEERENTREWETRV